MANDRKGVSINQTPLSSQWYNNKKNVSTTASTKTIDCSLLGITSILVVCCIIPFSFGLWLHQEQQRLSVNEVVDTSFIWTTELTTTTGQYFFNEKLDDIWKNKKQMTSSFLTKLTKLLLGWNTSEPVQTITNTDIDHDNTVCTIHTDDNNDSSVGSKTSAQQYHRNIPIKTAKEKQECSSCSSSFFCHQLLVNVKNIDQTYFHQQMDNDKFLSSFITKLAERLQHNQIQPLAWHYCPKQTKSTNDDNDEKGEVTEKTNTITTPTSTRSLLSSSKCYGIMNNGNIHISFYKWIDYTNIVFDLFFCNDEIPTSTACSTTIETIIQTIKETVFLFDEHNSNHNNSTGQQETTDVVWSYKSRHSSSSSNAPKDKIILNGVMKKELITSVQTRYHEMDVYDITVIDEPNVFGFQTQHQQQQQQQKSNSFVSIDGTHVSPHTKEYYESLVHPGMMSIVLAVSNREKKNKKKKSNDEHSTCNMMMRIAVIGNAHTMVGIVQELFKYNKNTIEQIVLIEKDDMLLNLSQTYFSTSSSTTSSTTYRFDDNNNPQVTIVTADPIQWFTDRYNNVTTTCKSSSSSRNDNDNRQQFFDVIIMDAVGLDRQLLFTKLEFVMTLSKALTADGILITSLGSFTMKLNSPPVSIYYDEDDNDSSSTTTTTPLTSSSSSISSSSSLQQQQQFLNYISNKNNTCFEYITMYTGTITTGRHTKSHQQQYPFGQRQQRQQQHYVVAMKDRSVRAHWISSEAEMELTIRTHTTTTTATSTANDNDDSHDDNNNSLLEYFDGATMKTFEFPSRIVEEFLNVQQHHKQQHGFDPYIPSYSSESSFEVRSSTVNTGGRGVFAKEYIPRGSYIGIEDCVNGMFLSPTVVDLILTIEEQNYVRYEEDEEDDDKNEQLNKNHIYDNKLVQYMDGYGWYQDEYGLASVGVDPGIFTFSNHGCNGTYNFGKESLFTETTFPYSNSDDVDVDNRGNNVYFEELVETTDTLLPFDVYDTRHFPQWHCHLEHRAVHDIQPGEEVFDNYVTYGGTKNDELFYSNLDELRAMCSGELGLVSQYETTTTTATNTNNE